jgi:putative ABC transport system ATP-binding protein
MRKKSSIITLVDVIKKYPVAEGEFYQALKGISLDIKEGDFVAIMGPSGSGKSTLMHIMGALDTATSGKQLFQGKNIVSYTSDQLAQVRNREIGFVFQSFNLLPRTSVFKNVERPMIYGGVPKEERAKRVNQMLALMQIADKTDSLSNQLSGGQTQRVAIARALVMNPSVILADEPTGNLDTKTAHEIMSFISNLNKQGKTIVLITHELDIAKYAKRHIKLVDGKIVSDETR